MVYNSTQTGIDDVRVETGNLLPADYPDAQITKKLNAAFSAVQLAVGRSLTDPFDSTNTELYFATELELKIAARDALKPYEGDPNILAKVTELTTEIDKDIAFLKENLQETGGTGGANILMAVTSYLSYSAAVDEDPNQTSVHPYRSGITDTV